MPTADDASSARPEAMVWIEDGSGSIARGFVGAMSIRGALVRLDGSASFEPGDEVALRICFERGAPTVGTTARVVTWCLQLLISDLELRLGAVAYVHKMRLEEKAPR